MTTSRDRARFNAAAVLADTLAATLPDHTVQTSVDAQMGLADFPCTVVATPAVTPVGNARWQFRCTVNLVTYAETLTDAEDAHGNISDTLLSLTATFDRRYRIGGTRCTAEPSDMQGQPADWAAQISTYELFIWEETHV